MKQGRNSKNSKASNKKHSGTHSSQKNSNSRKSPRDESLVEDEE